MIPEEEARKILMAAIAADGTFDLHLGSIRVEVRDYTDSVPDYVYYIKPKGARRGEEWEFRVHSGTGEVLIPPMEL